MAELTLYRPLELAFRTQYAELKERTRAAGSLLPGTPGTLALRSGTGRGQWYRVYYPAPGKQAEEWVAPEGDRAAYEAMQEKIGFARWVSDQVVALRKLGFQVADKGTARVLVELHNSGAFEAGLVLVGTLSFMAWLNELGAMAVSARTQDVDLARRRQLKLAAPLAFLPTMQATGLPFVAVPAMPSSAPSTSVKLPGVEGLRVDVLAPAGAVGKIIQVPELQWAGQGIPHYDYLLEAPEAGAVLAGGHCVPVRLPQAARLVWHKLYSSLHRSGFPEKAAKDLQQALVLAAVLAGSDDAASLAAAFKDAPRKMAGEIRAMRSKLLERTQKHAALQDVFREALRVRRKSRVIRREAGGKGHESFDAKGAKDTKEKKSFDAKE